MTANTEQSGGEVYRMPRRAAVASQSHEHRCPAGAVVDFVEAVPPRSLNCILPDGHGGWHVSADGVSFGTVEHEHRWVTEVERVNQHTFARWSCAKHAVPSGYEFSGVCACNVFCAVPGCEARPDGEAS